MHNFLITPHKRRRQRQSTRRIGHEIPVAMPTCEAGFAATSLTTAMRRSLASATRASDGALGFAATASRTLFLPVVANRARTSEGSADLSPSREVFLFHRNFCHVGTP